MSTSADLRYLVIKVVELCMSYEIDITKFSEAATCKLWWVPFHAFGGYDNPTDFLTSTEAEEFPEEFICELSYVVKSHSSASKMSATTKFVS